MRVIEAQAKISAKDATGSVFSAIQAKIRGLTSAAESANRRAATASVRANVAERARNTAKVVSGVSAGMMGLPGLGVAGAAFGGVKAFRRYAETDSAVQRIGITADATDEQVGGLTKSMRDLAFDTGQSFDKVSKGMESLVAGGMDLDKAMPALPAIARTAQAAGAEVEDMATTTLALNQALGIGTDKMQASFDALVTAGKAGKFELKDMARYLPSILPAVAALGYKGQEGLEKVAALMQTLRAGTGTTEEAATSLTNIFQKMESEETVNKFEKMGVNLRKEMEIARKSGKDLLETFKELTIKALKGDMSKIPQLFSDQQMARGMTAWLTFGNVFAEVMERMKKSAGAANVDLEKMLTRPQIALNRLSESFDRATTAAGAFLDKYGATKALNWIAKDIEDTVENGPRYPNMVGERDPEKKRLDREIDDAKTLLRKGEEGATRPGPGLLPHMKREPLSKAEVEKRMQSPELRALRQRVFEAEQKRYAAENDQTSKPLFDPKETERWEEIDREHRRGKALSEMKSATRAKKAGVPLPARDPRKIFNDGSDGSSNTLDLPYQGGGEPDRRAHETKVELTGSAEVKGQTEITVKVEAGSSLIAVEADTRRALAELRGLMRAGNGPGSNGRSSPDASPRGW